MAAITPSIFVRYTVQVGSGLPVRLHRACRVYRRIDSTWSSSRAHWIRGKIDPPEDDHTTEDCHAAGQLSKKGQREQGGSDRLTQQRDTHDGRFDVSEGPIDDCMAEHPWAMAIARKRTHSRGGYPVKGSPFTKTSPPSPIAQTA